MLPAPVSSGDGPGDSERSSQLWLRRAVPGLVLLLGLEDPNTRREAMEKGGSANGTNLAVTEETRYRYEPGGFGNRPAIVIWLAV